MKNNEFRAPLIQSGALLVAIIFVISLIPSGDSMNAGTIISTFVGGVFKFVLYLIALFFGLAVSIAVLIGVFLGAVALQSPEQASAIYSETKCRLAGLFQGSNTTNSISTESATAGISQEEYDKMKAEISSLQSTNQKLSSDISSLTTNNAKLQDDLHSLNQMVNELKESEKKTLELIADLSAKLEEDPTAEVKGQILQLEQMNTAINDTISDIGSRLELLEEAATSPEEEEPQSGGIFSYIESKEDQALFTSKVEEGVEKELTYAQFDTFLTEELPAELDQVIKDHPSLTKDFIRNKRK